MVFLLVAVCLRSWSSVRPECRRPSLSARSVGSVCSCHSKIAPPTGKQMNIHEHNLLNSDS